MSKQRIITINSETKTLTEWCKICNLKPNTINYRIRVLNYPPDKAITKEIQQRTVRNKRLSHIWNDMIQRCYNPKRKDFYWYGRKGIKVCNEWLNDFKIFEKWAFENNYSEILTIDRIDNNGDYCPENCRWVTFKEQRENTTQTLKLTIKGKTQSLKKWCKELGLNYLTVYKRYQRGKTLLEALYYEK